jgi:RNA polymerase sigma factor (sigma-70 family)
MVEKPKMHQHDDAALLTQFQRQRDPAAFSELVRRYTGWVYGTSLRACRDQHLAEDATQECFLELARQAHRIRDSVPAWLHTVARRIASRLRTKPDSEIRENDFAVEANSAGELLDQLDQALDELSPDLRALLLARFIEALNQEQLAERFNLSQATVSRRLEQGIAELRQRMKAPTANYAEALAALVVAPSLDCSRKLGKLALAAPKLAKPIWSIPSVAAAVVVLVVVITLSSSWRPRSTNIHLLSNSEGQQPGEHAIVRSPITLCVRSWPLIDVIDFIRDQLPSGQQIMSVPFSPGQVMPRVDIFADGVELATVLDDIVKQTKGEWSWQVVDENVIVDYRAPQAGAQSQLTLIANELRSFKELVQPNENVATLHKKYGEKLHRVYELAGGTCQSWLPEQSPLVAFVHDRAIIAAIADAWRHALENHVPISPYFCHVVGALEVREAAPDLERIMDDPASFYPDLEPARQYQGFYIERVHQAAIWALGTMRWEGARERIEQDLIADKVPFSHVARFNALQSYADPRSSAALQARTSQDGHWVLGAARCYALATVAPDRLVDMAIGTEGEPWRGFWSGY